MVINSPVVWLEFTLPTCGLKSVTLWVSLSLSLSLSLSSREELSLSFLNKFTPSLGLYRGFVFFLAGHDG